MHDYAQTDGDTAENHEEEGEVRVPVWKQRTENIGTPEDGVRDIYDERQRCHHENHDGCVQFFIASGRSMRSAHTYPSLFASVAAEHFSAVFSNTNDAHSEENVEDQDQNLLGNFKHFKSIKGYTNSHR